jgi:hypothetical protein
MLGESLLTKLAGRVADTIVEESEGKVLFSYLWLDLRCEMEKGR